MVQKLLAHRKGHSTQGFFPIYPCPSWFLRFPRNAEEVDAVTNHLLLRCFIQLTGPWDALFHERMG